MNDAFKGTVDQAVDALIKDFIAPMVIKSVMTYLLKKIPFFGLAFINPIVGFIVTELSFLALQHASKFFKFVAIDADVAIDVKEYEKKVDELRDALDTGDPEATAKAKEEFKRRARELIRIK